MITDCPKRRKEEGGGRGGWESDPLLPPGWLSRPAPRPGRPARLLSPGGRVHRSRLAAVQRHRHNLDTVEQLAAGLGGEGWTAHRLLPPGWRMKTVWRTKTAAGRMVRTERALQCCC